MHLLLVGISHRTAPVELRERVDFQARGVPAALGALAARSTVPGADAIRRAVRDVVGAKHPETLEADLRAFDAGMTAGEAAGGDKPMVGGSITVSQDILNYKGKRRDSLVGTIAGSPIADAYDGAEFKKFVADYKKNYPDGYPSPSLFALVYYINMKAALDGLELVKGDLSGGQAKYRQALSTMTLKTPVGDVKLDANRQAIGSTFVTEVVKDSKGNLFNKVLRKVDGIDQMLGMKKEDFQMGSRDVPNCP